MRILLYRLHLAAPDGRLAASEQHHLYSFLDCLFGFTTYVSSEKTIPEVQRQLGASSPANPRAALVRSLSLFRSNCDFRCPFPPEG